MVYFDYLDDALLQGRLDIPNPPDIYDLTFSGGQWYLPFLPAPSILMMPFVLLFGPGHGIEVPFSAFVGGLNVALVYLILVAMRRRGWSEASHNTIIWLTALFGFGTVHWYLAADGEVWYLSQITTVTFVALAVLYAVRQAPAALIGTFLGLALWTRAQVGLYVLFLGAELWSRLRGTQSNVWRHLKQWAGLLVPVGLSVIGLAWYNWARFGSAFDFGYMTENVNPRLTADLQTYGQFNFHFLGRNAYWALASLPRFSIHFPFFAPDPTAEGLSIFFVTPALVHLFRRWPQRVWMVGAWASILSLNVLLLTYYNTGWNQFGYRFSLDYLILAVCLLAGMVGKQASPLFKLLVVVSILVNARGVCWWFYSY